MMTIHYKAISAALLSGAALSIASMSALAQNADSSRQNDRMSQQRSTDAKARDWQEMRQNAVKASEILDGNVTNGLNPVAQVTNLVLNKNGDELEYIIYESRSPVMSFYVGDGYTSYNTVDLESSYGGGVDVRVDSSADVRGPEEIEITRDEADQRLVSHVLESQIELDGGKIYQVEDLLIQPQTGKITHYVIGSEPDVLFSDGRRTVRATEVSFRNGEYRSDLSMQDIDKDQPYEEDWL